MTIPHISKSPTLDQTVSSVFTINNLPKPVLKKIFYEHIPAYEFMKLKLVCKKWNQIVSTFDFSLSHFMYKSASEMVKIAYECANESWRLSAAMSCYLFCCKSKEAKEQIFNKLPHEMQDKPLALLCLFQREKKKFPKAMKTIASISNPSLKFRLYMSQYTMTGEETCLKEAESLLDLLPDAYIKLLAHLELKTAKNEINLNIEKQLLKEIENEEDKKNALTAILAFLHRLGWQPSVEKFLEIVDESSLPLTCKLSILLSKKQYAAAKEYVKDVESQSTHDTALIQIARAEAKDGLQLQAEKTLSMIKIPSLYIYAIVGITETKEELEKIEKLLLPISLRTDYKYAFLATKQLQKGFIKLEKATSLLRSFEDGYTYIQEQLAKAKIQQIQLTEALESIRKLRNGSESKLDLLLQTAIKEDENRRCRNVGEHLQDNLFWSKFNKQVDLIQVDDNKAGWIYKGALYGKIDNFSKIDSILCKLNMKDRFACIRELFHEWKNWRFNLKKGNQNPQAKIWKLTDYIYATEIDEKKLFV